MAVVWDQNQPVLELPESLGNLAGSSVILINNKSSRGEGGGGGVVAASDFTAST